MNTPDDWRIVSYSKDMQTMSNDRLTLKRQYYNIEALDISDNEVLMCKFCATNPEMRHIAREYSKYNNKEGEQMAIEYIIAGTIQLIILYNIWRSITTWSDDQSIEKKFRNSNKDKEK